MASWAEVLGDGAIRREEALGVPWRLEALHPPFSLARQLVGVLGAVVQVAMLPMLDTGEEVPLRRAVAFQLVGDERPWRVRQAFEQLPEELFGRMLVPPTLHQDIEDVPLLIDRSPEIVSLAVNREKDFIQMPRVTWLGAPATQLVRVGLTKLAPPLANRFIRHEDAAGKQ